MKKINYIYISILVLFVLLLSSCYNHSDKPVVFVSIIPQKFFVEKIAGDKIDVSVMVSNGMSPATYEPLPQQMIKLAKSKIYFSIGVPFENNWLDRLKDINKNVMFVNTAEYIKLRPMKAKYEILHSTDSTEESHSHNGLPDPHIWLNPRLVKIQSKTILKALIDNFPSDSLYFRDNYIKFIYELDSLDNYLRTNLASAKIKNFMVFHPSWGYFAEEYGLTQIPIEIEGKEPGLKELGEIITLAKKKNIKAIFVQKQFSSKSADAIAKETRAAVIPIDPLSEDYINNLKNVAHLLISNSN
jgi:zinc transport system substrate-binding protein